MVTKAALAKKIPKKFKIMGQVIKVTWSNNLYATHAAYGLSDFNHNTIILQAPTSTVDLPEELVMVTFYHEQVHHMLNILNYHKENMDEQFVDLMGNALYQIETTKE